MKRAIAGVYFAVVCLHAVLWLAAVLWPAGASGPNGVGGVVADGVELLGILAVPSSLLMLVATLFGLVEPRKPVALITAGIVLSMCLETIRAVSTIHSATHATPAEGAIAALILLLGVAGLIVVAKSRRKAPASAPPG